MEYRKSFTSNALVLGLAACALATAAGCDRDDGSYRPFQASEDPVVFLDAYGSDVIFQPFLNTKLDAVQLATAQTFGASEAALRIDIVPATPEVQYSGGAFTSIIARDFSGYNALRLRAKANRAVVLNEIGIGNDNTGTSRYTAFRQNVALGTDWREILIPIPDPSKMRAERGLLYFAEGFEGDPAEPYSIWLDEIEFAFVRGLENPRPSIDAQNIDAFVGTRISPSGGSVLFEYSGADIRVSAAPAYYDYYVESGESVEVEGGTLRVVAGGDSQVRARLGGLDATGLLSVSAVGVPAERAPTPTFPAANVLSLFSGPYASSPVDTWSAPWAPAELFELSIDGDAVKGYTGLSLNSPLAAEFTTQLVDATSYDRLRIDVWVPQDGLVAVKLVDFGEDGLYDGEVAVNDTEAELGFGINAGEIIGGQWNTIDVALADFESSPPAIPPGTLASRAHLAQLIIRSDTGSLFLDNVLFYREAAR